jgi:5-bromo-4-chloroindolyl phosphate hydrolysis protein
LSRAVASRASSVNRLLVLVGTQRTCRSIQSVTTRGAEMDAQGSDEREIRAARNQSMFRRVNQQILALNTALADLTETFAITCECADATCIELLQLRPREYNEIRENPRQFAVFPGHVYPDVERVVAERDGYTVVEKLRAAAEVAEALE